MKRRLAILAIALLGIVGAAAGPTAQAHFPPDGPTATASHSCSSGYTHAVTPGGHKCLRAGQYCSHKPGYGTAYRNAGYRCKANGRLVQR